MFHLTTDKDYDICMTKDCVTAASRIIQDMDASIDPCEDFYAFSCGGFIDNTNVPADKAQVGTMSQMRVSNFNSFFVLLNFNKPHYCARLENDNLFYPQENVVFHLSKLLSLPPEGDVTADEKMARDFYFSE